MSKFFEKSSERKMTALAEAQSIVVGLAGSAGTAKERLLRASRILSELSFSRVRCLFYGDDRSRIRADELEYLRRIQSVRTAEREKTAAKNEYSELVARIDRVEALLRADPDFYRPQADAFRAVSGLDHRSMDR